ncbi:MAG: radical SAM protein, partial [Candidatus Falkowbacteria bacterium]|nr:radical SAM protein [Candidatus Falkowbacteria bacterium]
MVEDKTINLMQNRIIKNLDLSKVDILFINPPSPDRYIYIRDINRSGRRSKEREIWPQTSLAYLAAMVREKYSVGLIDCIAEEMDWVSFKDYLLQRKPRYIAFNIISSIITNDIYTAYLAKTIGAITIGLGPHVTELPMETLKRYPPLDLIIRNEAEATILELIDCCEHSGDLSQVRGVAWRKGLNEFQVNPDRPFIEDLDVLPIPAHDLLPIKKYRLPIVGNNFTFILTGRGCPFQCSFCRQMIMWKYNVRLRSAESIFQEMEYLSKKLGVNNYLFHSDTFTINRNIVIELCKKIVNAKLPIRWMCNGRVDTIDEEMLQWMKKAGCYMIAYGLESGSQKILDAVEKGFNISQSVEAVKLTKKNGIKVWGYFVIGLPGENKETINETIKFSKSLPLDYVNFSIGTPYPGTRFYNQAKENRWLKSDNCEDFDQNYSAIVDYPNFSSKDIEKAATTTAEYFQNTDQVATALGLIKSRAPGAFSGFSKSLDKGIAD